MILPGQSNNHRPGPDLEFQSLLRAANPRNLDRYSKLHTVGSATPSVRKGQRNRATVPSPTLLRMLT